MTRADALDEGGGGGIVGGTAPQKVRVQRRIRQLENRLETPNIGVGQPLTIAIQEALQDGVELAHPPPAPPLQPSDARIHGTQ